MSHTAIALLSVSLALQAAAEVHLLPFGEFVGRDGRPGKGLSWKLFDSQGRALAAALNQRHAGHVAFNLDYEHQALLSEKNGQPAPAAGWATRFEWRDGAGLFTLDMQWTDKAKQMIEAGEYRYISPALVFDKRNGNVVGLVNASLTNIPNLNELNPVAQERIAALNAFSTTYQEQPVNPLLQALLKALNLPETVSEQDATTAVAALKAKADEAATLTTEVATLKAKTVTDPDPTKFVSLDAFNQLNTEIVALKAVGVAREVDELINKAKAEGKVTPGAEQVWRNVGNSSIAQLREMVDKTPANPALAGKSQTDGSERGESNDQPAVQDLVQSANKYAAEQAALGVHVSSVDAVNHVIKQQRKA